MYIVKIGVTGVTLEKIQCLCGVEELKNQKKCNFRCYILGVTGGFSYGKSNFEKFRKAKKQ